MTVITNILESASRVCRRCSTEKPRDAIHFILHNKENGRTWLDTTCRECISSARRVKYHKRQDVIALKESRIERLKTFVPKPRVIQYSQWSPERKLKRAEYCRKYRKDYYYRPHVQAYYKKKYNAKKGTPEFAKRNRDYMRNKRCNPAVRFLHNARIRIRKLLNRNHKGGRVVELLGCSPEWAVKHLTGGHFIIPSGHHVDHYIPAKHFNLSDPSHQFVCFNWRNLQLLTAFANLSKHDRLPLDYRERELAIRQALSLDGASL